MGVRRGGSAGEGWIEARRGGRAGEDCVDLRLGSGGGGFFEAGGGINGCLGSPFGRLLLCWVYVGAVGLFTVLLRGTEGRPVEGV